MAATPEEHLINKILAKKADGEMAKLRSQEARNKAQELQTSIQALEDPKDKMGEYTMWTDMVEATRERKVWAKTTRNVHGTN